MITKENLRAKFLDIYLLVCTTKHNISLYISVDFDRFIMAWMLVDPITSVNIISLIIIIYL